ncbi:MAG: phosphotransacetylase family protein [Acaryochloridaceae cyanobacterium SU_2_1]|nr:phosphotransacetylase family protein [Acaryochloridaceae cyanobacterium SU_2_1]
MSVQAKYLLIGSIEAFSGKSATILGLAKSFLDQGLSLCYGKPIRFHPDQGGDLGRDADVQFISQTLGLSVSQVLPTVLTITADVVTQKLLGQDQDHHALGLSAYQEYQGQDLVLLEGPSSLNAGSLFDLSLAQISARLDAGVLLVARFGGLAIVDVLLTAKQQLGDRLLGLVFNDVDSKHQHLMQKTLQPYLEAQGIPVLGVLPRHALLRSVSVGELVYQLQAEVLVGQDFLNLMVEQLTIGAMNVNSALKYFRKGKHMAVVTGGDRTDLQLAALESSTHCLILTGHFPPNDLVLSRAEDLEIPVLLVDLDTLTTVEIVEQAFQQAQLHESVKVECVQDMVAQHCDIDRLLSLLGFTSAVTL